MILTQNRVIDKLKFVTVTQNYVQNDPKSTHVFDLGNTLIHAGFHKPKN